MTVTNEDKVQWIPLHMQVVLRKFGGTGKLSSNLRNLLAAIDTHFEVFKAAKEESGNAWESLFVITFIIRAVTNQFKVNHDFSIIDVADHAKYYTVSFNRCGAKRYTMFEEYKQNVTPPESAEYPHIAIYYPSHSKFMTYDLLAAVYEQENGDVKWHGYQLKEGRHVTKSHPVDGVRSIAICGVSAKASTNVGGWEVLAEACIDELFGVSGKEWTPRRWRELLDE
jgi:hypothetical protein